ncbi:MAG: hypothetical protein ACFHX7_04585 [Pseudomonadota bacterium]
MVTTTLAFFLGVDRFVVVPQNLLETRTDWQYRGDVLILPTSEFQLRNESSTRGSSLYQEFDRPGSGLIQLSAEMTIEQVAPGPKFWQFARIDLEGRRAEPNSPWEWLPGTKLIAETGTGNYQASQVMSVAPLYPRIRVSLDLTGATGLMTVRNLAAFQAIETPAHIHGRRLLAMVWLLVAMLAAVSLWRYGFHVEVLVAISGGLVLFFTPAWMRGWIEGLNERVQFSVEHTSLFLLLGLVLLGRTSARVSPLIMAGYLVCAAGAAETAQWFTPTREPSLVDGLSNLAGICLALGIWCGYRYLIKATGAAPPKGVE